MTDLEQIGQQYLGYSTNSDYTSIHICYSFEANEAKISFITYLSRFIISE